MLLDQSTNQILLSGFVIYNLYNTYSNHTVPAQCVISWGHLIGNSHQCRHLVQMLRLLKQILLELFGRTEALDLCSAECSVMTGKVSPGLSYTLRCAIRAKEQKQDF